MIGKTKKEVEDMLKRDELIELNLSERKSKYNKDDDDFNIYA